MKIIEHGKNFISWIGKCDNCHCKVECDPIEVLHSPSDSNVPNWIECPECACLMSVNKVD